MLTLGDELAAALPELRALAESLMLDTCTVDYIADTVTDPLTGVVTPTYGWVYGPDFGPHFGKCKFQTREVQESNPEAGGATFTVLRSEVHFPVGAFFANPDLIITWATSSLDPNQSGRKFRVLGAKQAKTATTAYRLAVEEIV